MSIQTRFGILSCALGRSMGAAALAVSLSVAGGAILGAAPAHAGLAAPAGLAGMPRGLASAMPDAAGVVEEIGYRHHRRRGIFTRGHHRHYRHHRRHHRHYRHHRYHRGHYRRSGPRIGVYIGVPYGGYAHPFGHYYVREFVPRHRPHRARHHARPRPWTPAWYDYCRAKYRSFDARTGRYLAYSGRYRMCR